jgi:hypothetical protein
MFPLRLYTHLTEVENERFSRLRRAAEFDDSFTLNVYGRSYIITPFPRPKRIKGRRTPHFALSFGGV